MPAVAKKGPPVKRRKGRKIRKKPRKLRLKGWFTSPEDWAKFDAWAAVNALPKKIPEPEPIVRPAKPLRLLRKRAIQLSKIPKSKLIATECKVDTGISKAALHAKAKKRTKRLARPRFRLEPPCNEGAISRAALKYKASDHIIGLSIPKLRKDPEDCRTFQGVSTAALKRKSTEKDKELSTPKKFKTDEDEDDPDKKKKANEGELSPWMEFLTIPKYIKLMDQKSDRAEKWKNDYLDGLDVRGKQALKEQQKKRAEEKRKQEEEKKRLEEEKRLAAKESKSTMGGEGGNEDGEEEEAAPPPTPKPSKRKPELEPEEQKVEEDEETKKKRRMEKEPWRFEDITCKEIPAKIPKSTLNYEASEATTKLAVPKIKKDETCLEDPFKVKESAKNAEASPAIEALAKPKYTAEPVERPPPREHDQFGKPIIPKPVYGKVIPKVKPYKPRDCKKEKEDEGESEEEGEDEGEEREEEKKEKEKKKENEEEKPIDKIAFEHTIDPLFDRGLANKQAKERKRAAELAEKEKQRKKEAKEATEAAAAAAAEKTAAAEETAKTEQDL